MHGGITFGESDVPCDAPGPDTDWWLGFDCAHSGDAPDPALQILFTTIIAACGEHGKVRSQSYVEAECKSLCLQAREAALAMSMEMRPPALTV